MGEADLFARPPARPGPGFLLLFKRSFWKLFARVGWVIVF